jgi:hypothetical protein
MPHPFGQPRSRREALTALAAGSGALLWPWRALAAAGPVVEPEQFGPIADERGDAAPAINAAIADLVSAGGGTLRFRSGKTYLLGSTVAATARSGEAFNASIGLPAGARNLVIDLNGATLRQVSDAFSIGTAYRMFNDRQVADSAVALAGTARRGDTSVRLRGNARPMPGAVVMLVAGNTLVNGAYAPMAEMAVIARAAGDRVWFDRPLRKDYIPHGNWPHGLIDVTALSLRNLAIVGPGRIVNTRRRVGNVLQANGLTMENVTCEGRGGMNLRGRDIVVTDCSAAIQADWKAPVYRPYCLAFDTGTSDVAVRNFHAAGGDNMAFLHLHEGQANVAVSDLVIENGTRTDPRGESPAAISILGGSWNVSIARARVVNNPQGSAIEARRSGAAQTAQSDLSLTDLAVEGWFRDSPVRIVADTGRIDGLDLRRARTSRGKPLALIGGRPELQRIQGWAPG